MSLFDEDILTTKSDTEKLADEIENWVRKSFDNIYDLTDGSSTAIAQYYNYNFRNTLSTLFLSGAPFLKDLDVKLKKNDIYHTWFHVDKTIKSNHENLYAEFEITLFYSNDPVVYAHTGSKKLFKITINHIFHESL